MFANQQILLRLLTFEKILLLSSGAPADGHRQGRLHRKGGGGDGCGCFRVLP